MTDITNRWSSKNYYKGMLITAVVDTVIALFLTAVDFGTPGFGPNGFYRNFVFSQCIGLSCCSLIMGGHYILKPQAWFGHVLLDGAGMVMGVITGLLMGSVIMSVPILFFLQHYGLFMKIMIGSIVVGSLISYFFSIQSKVTEAENRLQEERIKRLTSEKEAIEANLRLLQAQIEPHFLFNSLSNILSLLDSDSEKGKSMLRSLTRYLRTSLSKTREDSSTVGQEMELIEDYLKIFKVRMGDRLLFKLDASDSVGDLPFPPMLIQPLVENAIKHGIEPKIEGGAITIRVENEKGRIRVEVSDTGMGLHANSDQGMGLKNIKDRLESLYAGQARLMLEENEPSGLKAVIEVPNESGQGNHRR